MGKYKHHSGAIGGGVNLSKGKTPHDSLMKYMPIDDKASGLFKMAKPFEMGVSMRGPLDKHNMHKGPDMYGKKHDGPNAYGKMKQGPLNQAKPDYIDIDGDGNKKESMKQAAAQKGLEMRGPLNQTQQSVFRPMTKEEIAKLKAEEAAKKGANEATQEKAGGNQVLKTNMERKITKKKPKKA